MHGGSVLSVLDPATRRLDPGRRIGLYEVEASIAAGGMGAVYRAREVESGRPVALKRMLEGGDATQFEIEARLLAHLDHPRVVSVIDHFADDQGTYTLVMDLIEGSDLARLLWDEGSPGLSVSYVLERAQEACEALDYLHAQSIVHGDIKPRNLVMSRAGAVVVDFGLAARMGHGSGDLVSSAGTARFMAPEVFMGDPISPRSDLYSLAASVWNLLSGSPPAYGEAEQLSELVRGMSPSLEEALRSALALDPGQRIASARELADALGVQLDTRRGMSLAHSLDAPGLPRELLEQLVRTVAGVFEASAASLAIVQENGDLLYCAAWGAVSEGVIGMRLAQGEGLAGAVAASGEPLAVPDCRNDPRFAAQVAANTGYVPHTMLVLPLERDGRTIGVLSILDRRDGRPYTPADLPRAEMFAGLAQAILA